MFLVENWKDEKLHISCRNRKQRDEIVVAVALSAYTAAWGSWIDQENLQNKIYDESLQSLSKAPPAYWWIAYL